MAQRTLLRLTVTTAGVEHSAGLPSGMTRLTVYCRTNTSARVSFTSGEVANDGGTEVSRNYPYDTVVLDSVSETLYYSSDVVGTILEAFAWHDTAKELGAFSDGYEEAFA